MTPFHLYDPFSSSWGGNRTEAGAQAQSVLMSVLLTAKVRGLNSTRFLSRLLCAPAGKQPLLIPA